MKPAAAAFDFKGMRTGDGIVNATEPAVCPVYRETGDGRDIHLEINKTKIENKPVRLS